MRRRSARCGHFKKGSEDPLTGGPVGTGALLTRLMADRMVARVGASTRPTSPAQNGRTTFERRGFKKQYFDTRECEDAQLGDTELQSCA